MFVSANQDAPLVEANLLVLKLVAAVALEARRTCQPKMEITGSNTFAWQNCQGTECKSLAKSQNCQHLNAHKSHSELEMVLDGYSIT